MTYVAYYRVSTQKQGRSGLGLEAQRIAVRGFVKEATIVAEFTEIESGKKNLRVQLQAAIEATKKYKATLIIAKLDRLSRNAAFIFTLRDSGIDFQCVDLPEANTLTIGIFATMAQHERELISSRTKAGLAVKKAQGVKLGKPENLTDAARAKAVAVIVQNAQQHPANKQAAELIRLYRRDQLSTRAIAAKLNEHGFATRSGKPFRSETVRRFLLKLSK